MEVSPYPLEEDENNTKSRANEINAFLRKFQDDIFTFEQRRTVYQNDKGLPESVGPIETRITLKGDTPWKVAQQLRCEARALFDNPITLSGSIRA